MDIVIEGKITADEGIKDILQTVTNLKSVYNVILRINSADNSIEGKIAFSQGGYILGGRLSTDECGYEAVRKLLTVTEGNYAVLDPGCTAITDVNQTLWLDTSRIVKMLPDLPPSSEALSDASPEKLKQILTPVIPAEFSPMASVERDVKPTTKKTRAFDLRSWRSVQLLLWATGVLVVAVLLVCFGNDALAVLKSLLKIQ